MQSQEHIMSTSDFQFGFKKKSSTVQFTFVVNEIINYYMSQGGKVYTTLLDASKAFDRVQYEQLFRLLIERKMCPCIARFLAFVYTNHVCRIKWCSSLSTTFCVKNGVKQGGVLSPMLFNIYLDVLLKRLEQNDLGCHVGNRFTGCFAYADDIVLLSPTVKSLNSMLKICAEFSNEYNITFNSAKSKVIVYGRNTQNVEIMFQGNMILQSSSEKHVGNLIGTDSEIDQIKIRNACNEMYAKVNLLLRQFGNADCLVIYKLFNQYCMSMYGSQLWKYEELKLMKPLYIAWRKCIRRILKIPNITHCNLVHLLCESSPLDTILHGRFLKFFKEACQSRNQLVCLAAQLVLNGSMSGICDSLNFICKMYDIDKSCIRFAKSTSIKHVNEIDIVRKAYIIKDFINYRDQTNDPNIQSIINFLCTD